MWIRRELEHDHPAVYAVHRSAFAPSPSGSPPVEAGLVEDLRRDPGWIPQLSLVAEVAGTVVGHVCCTRATLQPAGAQVLGLGPLGVLPDFHRSGAGTALMHAVIGAADALDETLIVLLGHADYYPRFGFRPAVELGILPPVPAWGAHFQARTLTGYHAGLAGSFRYAAPFDDL